MGGELKVEKGQVEEGPVKEGQVEVRSRCVCVCVCDVHQMTQVLPSFNGNHYIITLCCNLMELC